MRTPLNYSAPGVALQQGGFDPDVPVSGHYRMRLRQGAVFSAIRIWHGPPLDPVTGEELDRGHRWQCTINGQLADLERAWPRCAADAISKAEYDYLIGRQAWAQQHAPGSPDADPTKPIDLLSAPLPF